MYGRHKLTLRIFFRRYSNVIENFQEYIGKVLIASLESNKRDFKKNINAEKVIEKKNSGHLLNIYF